VPALAGLTTRDSSDFSIALLDAWATCLDILSFYQERIANESYLRTAVDSASVFALAQLVGYQPSPGVAASTFLAFTLNSAPGSPDNVLVPAGTRVQSVPAPGQSPQVFETSSDVTALIELNAIPPLTTLPWGLNPGDTSIWLQGTSNNINVGDGILFISQALYSGAAANSTSASGAADFHFVTSVTLDSTSGNTRVAWDQPLNWTAIGDNTAYIYVFRKKVSLFGVQAPDPRTLFSSSTSNLSNLTGWPLDGNGDWTFEDGYTSGSFQINLDASYPGTAPPKSGSPGWTVLVSPDYTALYQITAAVDTGPVLYTLTTKTTQLTLANGQILVSNIVSSANVTRFENAIGLAENALSKDQNLGLNPSQDLETFTQAVEGLSLALGASATSDQVLQDIVGQTRSATAYIQSAPLTPADPPYSPLYIAWDYTGIYQTQAGLLVPVEGSTLDIVGGEQISGGQIVAVSGQRVRLQVSVASPTGFVPNGATGSLPLSAGQIFLVDAFPPTAAPTGSDQLWQVITTGGVAGTLTIAAGNVLLIPADKKDPPVGESAAISRAVVASPIVTLSFTNPLSRIYDRATVTVNANVVAATQGETMNEILGSGDSANPSLQFTLKQSPLTWVSSPLGNGAVSTLQVWVNNMRWHEVDNFLDSGPADREFITRTDASQKVTVQFGGGDEGERTPTGQMNIRAIYRKGIGSAGNVQGGQLSQALDRPQGLSSVTNPDPAAGGADPDTASDARTSAPLHVLTLGRVVSLEDYQNYALAFAGIAQALATWTWSGRTRGVFLTVAGANGAVFQPDDATLSKLKESLWNVGNPYVSIQVVSYIPVLFEVAAAVLVDQTDYDPTQVLAQVWQSLAAAFSFDQRQMGQGVAQSEVIAVIQQTPGVIAVELTGFNRQGQPPAAGAPIPPVLRAAAPVPGQQGTPKGAEMLLLDPASQGNLGVWS